MSNLKIRNENGVFVSIPIIQGPKGDNGLKGDKGDPGLIQSLTAGTNISIDNTNPNSPVINSTASGGNWGEITGTLSNQTDLQTALNNLLPKTGGTVSGNLTLSSDLFVNGNIYHSNGQTIIFRGDSADVNQSRHPGYYLVTPSTLNLPVSMYGTLQVWVSNGNKWDPTNPSSWMTQILTSIDKMYIRQCVNGTVADPEYNTWRKISLDINTPVVTVSSTEPTSAKAGDIWVQ